MIRPLWTPGAPRVLVCANDVSVIHMVAWSAACATDNAGLITWDVSVDSTIARAHQHAAAARRDPGCQQEPPGGFCVEPVDHALGRSRGGLTTKLHLACEQGQKLLSILLTAGHRGDSRNSSQFWTASGCPGPMAAVCVLALIAFWQTRLTRPRPTANTRANAGSRRPVVSPPHRPGAARSRRRPRRPAGTRPCFICLLRPRSRTRGAAECCVASGLPASLHAVGRVVYRPLQDRLLVSSIYRSVVYALGVEALSEQSFLILAALADQPRHGYALVTEVESLSAGRIRLRASTLYAALERLVGRGLAAPDRDEVENGRLRRYYRLTDAGAAAVAVETQRMRTQAQAATRRLARRDRQTSARYGVAG